MSLKLRFDAEAVKNIDKLAARFGDQEREDVVRRALALLDCAADHNDNGYELQFRKENKIVTINGWNKPL